MALCRRKLMHNKKNVVFKTHVFFDVIIFSF